MQDVSVYQDERPRDVVERAAHSVTNGGGCQCRAGISNGGADFRAGKSSGPEEQLGDNATCSRVSGIC